MASIICARCGETDIKTGQRQKYCAKCQPVVKREQKTESERRRRARLGETLREYQRKRYSDNPGPAKSYALNRYYRIKEDPDALKKERAKNKKNMRSYRFGENWGKVFERDGGKCVICASTKRLGIHHRDGKGSTLPKEQQNNSLDNLVLVCQSCHMKIHAPYKERLNVKKKY